jgi:hypothetical protein
MGQTDPLHMSICHEGGAVAEIFRADGTCHPGPRYDGFRSLRPDSKVWTGGNGFIELGEWRIGVFDASHFSISHRSGRTAVIYRNDGTIHRGPRPDFSLWTRNGDGLLNVAIDSEYIDFANSSWRLGHVGEHLVLTAQSTMASCIWRSDGTIHSGPRRDFGALLWTRVEEKRLAAA